jgi:hypothetical protein
MKFKLNMSNIYIKFKTHLNKNTEIQNKNWYVLIALISSIIWLIIWLYTLLIPISNILNNVNTLSKDVNDLKYKYSNIYNPQIEKTLNISWWELINKYINYLNIWKYQEACSFISTLHCTMYDVIWFTNWVEDKKKYLTVKLMDWESLIEVWDTNVKLENTKIDIWCWEFEYYMNTEKNPVKEVRQYYILNRPDGSKEIWKILCEYAEKKWEDRTSQICWYQLENKKCHR